MRGYKFISLILDGKHITNLEVTKKNKIRDIKELLNNYQGKKIFYVNQKEEIPKVFEVDTYDNLTLESVWNKMVNPSITINTLAISPLKPQEYPQQFSFTGNVDVDRSILENLPDKDILMACSVNKFMYKKVCDDSFFQRLVLKRFPSFVENTTAIIYEKNPSHYFEDMAPPHKEIPPYKDWRDKYLNIVTYKDLLKREFNYEYKEGDPRIQYMFLKEQTNIGRVNLLTLTGFTLSDEPELIKYVIDKEGGFQASRVKTQLSPTLRYSIQNGMFNIANYLVKQGVILKTTDREYVSNYLEEMKKANNGKLLASDEKKIQFLNNL